jgi:hypothetical protein
MSEPPHQGFDRDWLWRSRLHSIRRAAAERKLFTDDGDDVDASREGRLNYEAQHARQRHSHRTEKVGRCRLCDARCEMWYCDSCCWIRTGHHRDTSSHRRFRSVLPFGDGGFATSWEPDEVDPDVCTASGIALADGPRCRLCDEIQSRAHDWSLLDDESRTQQPRASFPHKGRCVPYP